MHEDQFDAVVSTIYDAAIEVATWDDALIAIADALKSTQCALQFYDPKGYGMGSAPLMDPDFLAAYRQHWRGDCPVRRASIRQPAGKVYAFDSIANRDEFVKSEIFHEWWRPQNMGFGALGANLVVDGPNLAIASIYKAWGEDYTREEQKLFGDLMAHLIRATKVNRKMQLATMTPTAAPSDVILVDHDGAILMGGEDSRLRLANAGLLAHDGIRHRVTTADGSVERLVSEASKRRGGACRITGRDGSELTVEVVPVAENDGRRFPWLAVDRPTAFLHIADRAAALTARRARIAEAHGLTQAEAAVALEIAKGDGRAATAERLGIRETTVRSHLTSIFDKVGVHRQAELARLVLAA
jgi:DNA-binding CsgD family transcriptional regulator